jgi:hypothetical protein
MDLNHVDEAIVESYQKMRRRIGFLALAFPLVLILVGLCWGIKVQQTLSNYYFALDPDGRVDMFPVRLWFCGILFIVGFFLHKYHGFSDNEDRWLSVAGGFALGVAIFPMSIDGKNQYDFVLSWIPLSFISQLSLHGICAVLAFACIAVVIVWYSDSTLSELRKTKPAEAKVYKTIYVVIALFMIASIVISVILNIKYPQGDYILSAEWCGIWAFAAYWFVKNRELGDVAAEMKARGTTLPLATRDIMDKL